MKKSFIVLNVLLMTQLSFAVDTGSTSDLNSARKRDSWADQFNKPADSQRKRPQQDGTNADTTVQTDVSTTSAPVCTRKDQTSIPRLILEQDFLSQDLVPHHDASTGTLSVDGGMMKGNCASMLEYNWSYPDSNYDYTFQVEVKRPDKCEDKEIEISDGVTQKKEVCTYSVKTATDGIPNDEEMEVEVEPNYYGFIQCMKKTGALVDGKWQNDKIVPVEFKQSLKKAYHTGYFDYNCFGPECKKNATDRTVKTEEGGCRTLERFKKSNGNNFRAYSLADIKEQDMKDEFDTLCKKGDYKLLEKRLPAFKEFEWMYKILAAARDNMIEHQVKLLKKDIDKKKKNLSKVNVQKYNEVLSDFYKKIIQPLKNRILRGADDIANMDDGPEKEKLQKHLNSLIAKLRKYAAKPYLSNSDYKLMKSFAVKAPLHQDEWREAALITYATTNTAYHLSRYNPAYRKKDKSLVDMHISDVQDLMEDHQTEQANEMEQLGVLANDKEGAQSIAAGYEREARMIEYNYQQDLMSLQMDKQQIGRIAMQECSPGNYGMSGLVQSSCMNRYSQIMQMIDYEYQQKSSHDYRNKIYDNMNYYNQLSQQWKPIEAQRNSVYGVDPNVYQYNYQMTAVPEIMRNPNFAQQMQQQYGQFQNSPYPVNPNNPMANEYGRYLQQQALLRQQQQQQYQFMNYNRMPASSQYIWQQGQQPSYNQQGNFQWSFR